MNMKIFRTNRSIIIEDKEKFYVLNENWDPFINRDNLYEHINQLIKDYDTIDNAEEVLKNELLPPIGSQEIWGAGVTYIKSKAARQEEAEGAGGGNFYERVYHAKRPEIFFKASPHRTAGSGQKVRIREDGYWNVPEPELTLLISSNAKIIGYTIGNDMSARDIEGENPLYLPQAKTYDKSASIGPGIFISNNPIPDDTIYRKNSIVFAGEVSINQMKRKHSELVNYLFKANSFPAGCFLMTGTGIVPDSNFTLDHGDKIRITIDHIGTLINFVE